MLTLLNREVATPDQPLEGTHWVLDGILSGDAVSSVPAGVTASIRIVDGRVDVEAGCSTGGGTVVVTAETLNFGPIGLVKIACEPGAMAVELAVIGVLAQPTGPPSGDRVDRGGEVVHVAFGHRLGPFGPRYRVEWPVRSRLDRRESVSYGPQCWRT